MNFLVANPGGSMVQGMSNALSVMDQRRETKRKNALSDLYKNQGAGIASGDQNALNALAALDPMAARGINRENKADARADEQWQLRLQQHAASMSAAEREATAAQLKKGVFAASSAQTPEEWDALAQQFGVPDLAGRFDQKDALLSQYMTAAQIIEAGQPDKPADEYGRYVAEEQAAGRLPLSRIDFAQAKKGKGTTVYHPETGQPMISIGGGDETAPPKLTVDAAKNSGFLLRTQESNKVLNDLEEQGTRFMQQNLEAAPFGLGNYGRDPEFQKFDQARRDFVNAILRRESGAVISDQEFDNANKQYFPVPGDSAEVIAQKRRNRETAIEGLRVGSGEGASYVDKLSATPKEGQLTNETGNVTIDAGLLEYMTPDERALFE